MENVAYIKGYGDEYFIESNGSIFSTKSDRYLKGGLTNGGYKSVSLHFKGITKTYMVHRLIGLHFIKNTKNNKCINHKDGNKLNNNYKNLEWVTHSENSKHAQKNNLAPPPPSWKGKYGIDHNRSKSVKQIDAKTNKIIKIFGSGREAMKKTGIWHTGISMCATGKLSTFRGYKWAY